MLNKNTVYAILIIFAGFLTRLVHLKLPLFEVAMWRQCQTASVARNFYYYGMNIFYPQISYGGTTNGIVGDTEFQVYPFIVALLYKFWGVHEYLGRLVSILAFCGGAFFLYKLTRKYVGSTVGLTALLFYTFNPYIFFYSRAFMPESSMLFFSIAMLYFFSEWIDKEGWKRFALMTLCATLAFLIKIPTICLGLPLLYLCLVKFKYSFVKQWRLWLFACLSIIPTLLWYRHSHNLVSINNLTWSGLKLSSYAIYLDCSFYWRVFYTEILERDLLFVGGAFLVLGIIFTFKKKELGYIRYWLLAIVIFFFLGAEKTMVHTYYTIPLIAPASIFIGYAICNSTRLIYAYKITGIRKAILLAMYLLIVAPLPIIGYHKITGRYETKRLAKDYPVRDAGMVVDKIASKDDLIIGSLWGGPEILYYSNRRGWSRGVYACSIEYIETCRHSGAKYFVTTKLDVIDSSVIDYLRKNYETIKSTNEYLIVKL